MKRLTYMLICIFTFVLFLACSSKSSDKQIVTLSPAHKLENYLFFDPHSPLVDRITPCPDFVLGYLELMDNVDTYTTYEPTEKEMIMCAQYLDLLPSVHKQVLKNRLVGIYFIDNFLGSGMADFALDHNKSVYCNLFINPETMKHDMSTWMTFRENTCFYDEESNITIVQECGKEYTGLMYLLLHETTHIVDYIYNITPYIHEGMKKIFALKNNNTFFTKDIWNDKQTPVDKYDYDLRPDITFYGFGNGPKINKNDAAKIYIDCSKTPFSSLYGSKDWAEDWAEFVTWYHYTRVLHQPYEIRLFMDEELVQSFTPMEWEKVKERIPDIENIFGKVQDILNQDT